MTEYTDYMIYHTIWKVLGKLTATKKLKTYTFFFFTKKNLTTENILALWVWTKQVDEGPYWCYYTHMKWEPSVSWGGVLGDCGRGGEEDDRLFTAMKQSNMLNTQGTRKIKINHISS